ncbi:MAG: cyclic nucleotide-binding domain-containing protein, partial [Tannerella sp.]|nr:cyclic nucleotide-binding domain-containing protein [Tannerella sp.]
MEQITLTDEHKKILYDIPLFEGISNNVKPILLERLDFVLYGIEKNDIIARQNTPCKSLYILLEGQLRVDIIDGWGNNVMIEDIIAPRAFATPHLFSKDSTLPATFTVTIKGTLLKATKESVFKLISEEPDLLKNFLCVTGNCNKCTVTRLRTLTQKTIRNRIIVYLLEKKRTDQDWVMADHNNSQLADYLCVTRPALSKEI